jgi:tRNA pseudouridine65 synthase
MPILYRDQEVVVVNKPSGLLVHRSALDRGATQFALQLLRDQMGQHVYPVHRLDRATSGALVFALSSQSARELAQQFAAQTVNKTYLAVVRGTPLLKQRLEYALKEILDDHGDRQAQPNKPAQSAVTDFETLLTCEFPVQVDKYPTSRYALVKAIPRTGRKHQIRRHLRHLGHPIIGDITYGVGKHNRFFESTFQLRRLLLACVQIQFLHPVTNEQITVKAPLAEDFSALLKKIGWESEFV